MLELPGTAWRPTRWSEHEALSQAPQAAGWHRLGQAKHGFTHFELLIDVYAASVPCIVAPGLTLPQADLLGAALPTAMRRCIALALANAAPEPREPLAAINRAGH